MFQCHAPHHDGAAFTSSISVGSAYHAKRNKEVCRGDIHAGPASSRLLGDRYNRGKEGRFQYYEDKSSLQGRHGQGSQAQAIALVQKYKLACKLAAEKVTEFVFHHHRTVSQLAKRDYIASRRGIEGVALIWSARGLSVNFTGTG